MTWEIDLTEISALDCRILDSALVALERELDRNGNGGLMRDDISRVKKMLATRIFDLPAPPHVVVNQIDLIGLMKVLPSSSNWRLYLEGGEGDACYNVHAQVMLHQDREWNFVVAENLKGTGAFLDLAAEDLEFYRALEQRSAAAAGTSPQIIHTVVEIAMPWEFQPNDDMVSRLEDYLASVATDIELAPAIHSTFTDVHSDPELADRGYASIMAEISGFEDEISDSKAFIERHNRSLHQAAAFSR